MTLSPNVPFGRLSGFAARLKEARDRVRDQRDKCERRKSYTGAGRRRADGGPDDGGPDTGFPIVPSIVS
jgi:hypothetical protein